MIDPVRLSFLQWLEMEDNTRHDKRSEFRDYYEGEHSTQLTARQKKFLELSAQQSFNLNFCPLVVDALAERLTVTGFTCEDQPELLWDWWQLGRMDGVQGVLHTSAVRDGDGYILVEWDNERGRPRLSHESAYDGSEGVEVVYSDEDRNVPEVAYKKWLVTGGNGAGSIRRCNLYYPDRIEKYIAQSAGMWQEYQEEGRPWPETWTGKNGPLGIPVAHFRNKDQGYSYGESELEDVLPPQNLLNKTALDLIAAADSTAFRLPWMTGGKPENMAYAPGSWVYTTSPEAHIGSLDGADLANLIALKDSVITDIAKITRTPLSYFQQSRHVAAEGTLKQQESGLIGKVKNRQVVFGNAWEDAMMMARRLHNAFGPGGLDEEALVTTVWADPETRNEKEHLEGLKTKRELGVPRETIWAEMGYDADAIERMKEQAAAEEAQGIAGLGQALLAQERGFNGA